MERKKIFLGLLVLTMLLVVACTEETTTELYSVNGETETSEEETHTEDTDTQDTDADTEDTDTQDTDADTEDTDMEEMLEGITREEIAEHNSAESCKVGYYGYVYDLTLWLNEHPGGANEILPHCGTVEEFTEAYNNRHGQKDELNRNQAIAELI